MSCYECIGRSFVGLVTAATIYYIVKLVYIYFLRPGKDLKKYGAWAVVTGSTDGIGKAYAMELARKGLNIVLVSRALDKLNVVAKEIEDKHKVQTKVVAIDLSGDDSIYKSLSDALNDLPIGVLVNNAGVGYEHPEYFLDLPQSKIDTIVHVNMRALTMVTKIVLPGMVERRTGAIVNISSSSAYLPMGLLSVYSASKAYVDFFSRGLAQEYGPMGIDVQAVLPFIVATKLSKVRTPTLMAPSPRTFARQACNLIGYESQTPGYWTHHIQLLAITMAPVSIAVQCVMAMHENLRKRALAKKAREAKAQ